jgi:2-(1,2-epoxy-1,2-dihydrophenyl)acetyl-CoA isomerase
MLKELKQALESLARDTSVRAVLLMGTGRGFCSGADLANTPIGGDIGAIIQEFYNPLVRLIATMPKPVIAAVNGVAAGAGMSLALCCDMRLLSSAASFNLGFSGIALVLDASASYYLPRLVGRSRALELAYTNRKVGAEEALHLGLGEKLMPAEAFAEKAWAFAKELADGPTKSFGLIKEQLNAAASNDLETQLALEVRLQSEAAKSQDVLEGIMAFKEKRRPKFKGA